MFALLATAPPSRIRRLTRCTGCGRWVMNPDAHVGCEDALVQALAPPLTRPEVWRVPVSFEPCRGTRQIAITLDCGHVVLRWVSALNRRHPKHVHCRQCAMVEGEP